VRYKITYNLRFFPNLQPVQFLLSMICTISVLLYKCLTYNISATIDTPVVTAGPDVTEGLDKLFDSDDATCLIVKGTASQVPWILLELAQPVIITEAVLTISADTAAKSDGVMVFFGTVRMDKIAAAQTTGSFKFANAPAGAQAQYVNITHGSATTLGICEVNLKVR